MQSVKIFVQQINVKNFYIIYILTGLGITSLLADQPTKGKAGNTVYTEFGVGDPEGYIPEPDLPDWETKETPTPKNQYKPIEPPFGMEWGENPRNLLRWAKINRFKMIQGIDHQKNMVYEVQGPFEDVQFSRLRFSFSKNQLVEVEIQFLQKKSEDIEGILLRSIAIKENLQAEFGSGKALPENHGQTANSDWKCLQQIWSDEDHIILLNYYQAQPKDQTKKPLIITSIHYRWEKRITD